MDRYEQYKKLQQPDQTRYNEWKKLKQEEDKKAAEIARQTQEAQRQQRGVVLNEGIQKYAVRAENTFNQANKSLTSGINSVYQDPKTLKALQNQARGEDVDRRLLIAKGKKDNFDVSGLQSLDPAYKDIKNLLTGQAQYYGSFKNKQAYGNYTVDKLKQAELERVGLLKPKNKYVQQDLSTKEGIKQELEQDKQGAADFWASDKRYSPRDFGDSALLKMANPLEKQANLFESRKHEGIEEAPDRHWFDKNEYEGLEGEAKKALDRIKFREQQKPGKGANTPMLRPQAEVVAEANKRGIPIDALQMDIKLADQADRILVEGTIAEKDYNVTRKKLDKEKAAIASRIALSEADRVKQKTDMATVQGKIDKILTARATASAQQKALDAVQEQNEAAKYFVSLRAEPDFAEKSQYNPDLLGEVYALPQTRKQYMANMQQELQEVRNSDMPQEQKIAEEQRLISEAESFEQNKGLKNDSRENESLISLYEYVNKSEETKENLNDNEAFAQSWWELQANPELTDEDRASQENEMIADYEEKGGDPNWVSAWKQHSLDVTGWEQMAPEEKAGLNYLANEKGIAGIKEFMDTYGGSLRARQNLSDQLKDAAWAQEHPFWGAVQSTALRALQPIMFPTQVLSTLVDIDATNNVWDAQRKSQALRQGVGEWANELPVFKGKTLLGQPMGSAVSGIVMSLVDNMPHRLIAKQGAMNLAKYVFTTGAMSGSLYEGIERGMSVPDAFVKSIADGFIENLTESVSLEALYSGRGAKDFMYWLKVMGAEGSEEFAGGVLQPAFDTAYFKYDSLTERDIAALTKTGESNAVARQRIQKEILQNALMDGLGGAFSGAIFGGGEVLSNVRGAESIVKQAQKNGSAQGVLDYALELDTSSDAYKLAKKWEGKQINAKDLGKIGQIIINDNSLNFQEAKTEAEKQKAWFEMQIFNAVLRTPATTPTERADLERNERAQIKAQGEAEYQTMVDRQAKEAQAFENAERDILEANRGGVTAGIVEAENVAKQAQADIEQEKAAMLERHAKERETFENAERDRAEQENHRITKNLPEAVVKDMETVTDTKDKETYRVAYELGRYGMPENAIMQVKGFDKLGEENAQKAYNFGKDEHVRSLTDALKVVPIKPGQGKVTYEKSVNINSLTQEQKDQIPFVQAFSKAMGYNVHIYASKANAEGIFTAPNGSFDPTTGTIGIDINAGRISETVGKVIMPLTMGHELTHYLKASVPDLFQEYSGKVLQFLGENGQDIRELIDSKMVRARTQEIDLGDAIEEVIADASQMMLKDSTAIDQIRENSPTLYGKIKDWLKDFLGKINKAFKELSPIHEESKGLQSYANELQQLYDNMLVRDAKRRDTVENRQQDMSNFGSPDEARATETNNKAGIEDYKNSNLKLSERDSTGKELTQEQAEYFKDSKVRDAEGNLLTVYHGTDNEFTVFDKNRIGQKTDAGFLGEGFYFVENPEATTIYGKKQMPVYLNAINLLDTREFTKTGDLYDAHLKMVPNYSELGQDGKERSKLITKYLIDNGYDGITTGWQTMVLSPSQIKSTTNLSPTSSADIRYSERDTEQTDKSFDRSRDYLSPRDIIAGAMESVANTPGERKLLTEYKNTVGSLNALEREAALLRELNTQQRRLKADGDKTLIKTNVARIADIEAKIHKADMKLVKMQDAKPLKDLVTREGKIVHAKMMQEKRAAVSALRKAKNEIITRVKGEKKEAVADYRDKRNGSAAVTRIMTATKDMLKWVASPDAKKGNYIPDVIAGDILPLLRAIDTSSKRALKGGADTQADIMFAKAFAELEQAIKRLNKKQNEGDERGGRLELDNNLEQMLSDIKGVIDGYGISEISFLNRMSTSELEKLSKIVVGIKTAIKNWNKEYQVIGNNVVSRVAESSMQGWSKFHKKLTTNKTMQGVAKFLGWQNLQPIYAMERLGPEAVQLLKAARDGVDKTAFNIRDFVKFAEKAFKGEEVKAWESTFHTFEINGEQVRMPVAIMMDIYLESKRDQALGHMFGVGARIDDFADGKKNIQDKRRIYTPQLVEQINSKLTDRQKEVADKIQQYVSTVGAKYGNEISQILYGYDKYTEDNYWPIKMDRDQKNVAEPDAGARGNAYALQNASHTFAVQPGASNGIVFRNIFDVAAQHMSDMIQYNAMVIPIQQMNKWLNYRQNIRDESGTIIEQRNLREAMKQSYGDGATQYVQKLIEDMNSSRMISETDRLANRMLGRINRSVIGWNLRVSLLQPMAYTKALTLLDAGAMTAAIAKNATGQWAKNIKEMEQYSGIAEWKQQGHFDLNAGRSVSELVKRNGTKFDKFQEAGMWLAGTMDRITWGNLWEATKLTVTKRQGLKAGTDAHMKATAALFEEMVYKTQVVDNVLTRSEIMRDPSFTAKSFSSFKSEATQAYNMIAARVLLLRDDMASDMTKGQVWNKHKGALAKTFVAYTLTQAITALLESFMEAWRDDDEYATFLEKILENYMGNFTDNMLPVHIPFVDEAYSFSKLILNKVGVIKDYGFRPTSAIVAPFEQVESLIDTIMKYSDNKNKGVKGYELYAPISKALQLLSTMTGVSAKNMVGEPVDLWNNTFGQVYPKLKVYKYHGTRDGYDRLYQNELKGDTERADEIKTVLKRNEETDKTILSAITSKAKEDYLEGKLTKEEVTALLNKQPEADADEIYWLIKEWDEKADGESYSRYDTLKTALTSGKNVQIAIDELTKNGVKPESVKSQTRTIIKNAYLSGELSLSTATNRVASYAPYDSPFYEMKKWEYIKRNGSDDGFDYRADFYKAVDSGIGLREAIIEYTDPAKYNYTKSTLSGAITSGYKDKYINLIASGKRGEAATLKARLLTAYSALGYSRVKKNQEIDDWLKKI